MPYLVRRLQTMDLTFFAEHSRTIAGRQRGINIDSWLVQYLPFMIPNRVRMRYRHADSGRIITQSRPVGRLQKNVRLHGEMVRGAGYLRYGVGDIMLLHFSDRNVVWGVFQDSGNDRPIFRFLSDPANAEWRRNMALVRDSARIQALENLLSNYDPALWFSNEMEAIETEPSSPTVRTYIRRRISQRAFENLQRAREQNGRRGEEQVLDRERRRLTDAGHPELAERVRHVAAEDPMGPYDILSFEGTPPNPEQERFIEVKSTSGESMEFELSDAEWRFAEQEGDRHYICRVTQVTSSQPRFREIRNIAAEVAAERAERRPSVYRIRVLD